MTRGVQKLMLSMGLVFSLAPALQAQCPPDSPFLSADSLKSIVYRLADDSMMGRMTGSDGLDKARRWLKAEYLRNGLVPVTEDQSLETRFSLPPVKGTDSSRQGINILGAISGSSRPGEQVIVCAHYDHVGTRTSNPYEEDFQPGLNDPQDSIYNGANDNASGTAALISLMRYYAHCGPQARTVIFVSFSGEELGLLGSASLAAHMKPEKIVAVINLEMLGRRGEKRAADRPYIPGANYSSLRKLLNARLWAVDPKTYGKHYFQTDPYPGQDLFTRSDNYSFVKYGIPAHTIMLGSPHDPSYHSVKDEAGSLDYPLMSEIVKAIALSMEGLLQGTDTPSRVHF